MNTNFSLKRVGLLLRKDWIEYKKKMAYAALTIFGILLVLFLVPAILQSKVFHPFTFYVAGLVGSLAGICRYSGRVIHQSKGIYLALPASNEEKFVTLLIEGVIWFIIFQIVFWSGIGLGSLIVPISPISIQDLMVDIHSFIFLSFIASLLFLSFLTFRKFALGIAIGGFALALASIVGFVYLWKDSLFPIDGCVYYDAATPFFTVLTWLAHGFAPIFLIATFVVLYVAYLKLKEKELR